MHHDLTSLWKSDTPRFVVVLDAECSYDHEAHARYQASERFLPADSAHLSPRELRADPRVTPRWPCHRITTLSWLVMTEAEDGLRPIQLETRGLPEQDETAVLKSFFADMERLGRVQIVTWGGFHSDLPQILIGAIDAGLQLPSGLTGLLSPWRRDASGHVDLCTEMCGGAAPAHLAEVAARLGIPAKLICRPDLVSKLMQQGKWSAVRSVCEGDVWTTAALLMRWRHLRGGTASALAAGRRLTTFIAEHCSHRSYAADWKRYGDDLLAASFAAEARKLEILRASACN
ncbi:hypothetical protein DC429_16865 [Arthrobacter sp. TPD3018]|uniref:hypothetical protein n=1 Tax=Bacteria TaxID=2 RepID=UPI000D523FEA|nr:MULTISPECIES: hypothetical protein [Bacteria]PVE52002.1 hypothetical protein DC429_16865 [Arthrobacter sp. TPD3018]PVE54359.1 hypothetical protein DC425_11680 [Sphingomonas sp. TPD3009]PVE82822.1 hypothetical protein DC431_13015 [Sphingomonas melonis]